MNRRFSIHSRVDFKLRSQMSRLKTSDERCGLFSHCINSKVYFWFRRTHLLWLKFKPLQTSAWPWHNFITIEVRSLWKFLFNGSRNSLLENFFFWKGFFVGLNGLMGGLICLSMNWFRASENIFLQMEIFWWAIFVDCDKCCKTFEIYLFFELSLSLRLDLTIWGRRQKAAGIR